MPGEEPRRFVAESGHHDPRLGGLAAILDRFDARQVELAEKAPPEIVAVAERDQFALDYSAWREDGLRAALEEVVWYLEQRGHHAWLEDVGAEQVPAVLESGRERTAVPRPLVLRVVPAGDDIDAAAAQLRFGPDGDGRRVQIEAVFGDPASIKPVRLSVPLRLEEVTDDLVFDVATEFVRSVLFADERYPGTGVSPIRPPIVNPFPSPAEEKLSSDVGHEWADTGIAKRWLEQRRKAPG